MNPKFYQSLGELRWGLEWTDTGPTPSHQLPLPLSIRGCARRGDDLRGPPGAQIKRCFRLCLWGCFQVRLTFEWVDSVKQTPPPPSVDAGESSNPLRAWTEQKVEEGGICPFIRPHWAGTSHVIFRPWAGIYIIVSLVLKPSDSDWITPLAFLGRQLVDGRQWDFSASEANFSFPLSLSPPINK